MQHQTDQLHHKAAFDAEWLQMEMKIDGNLSVHQRTSRFRSDV
ncbi:hypothetical protein T03_1613 [Trichinella britovi]|uniref:Uncharacterized protein n=1 Tax=Trichinella britovi TaxID=45882 RepID=A0A0V0YS94_TRIBR|nr:hypothetical protein T03_1613 [Trichinella britovi]